MPHQAAPRAADETDIYTVALANDPKAFVDLPVATGFSLDSGQREAIEIAGLRRRFAALRPRIAMLDGLAREQGLDQIGEIADAARLLFPHTAYKSYPMSLLEAGDFGPLTRWLQGVTALDLGGFDGEGVASIDDWIAALDVRTGLQLVHTSGTTGKLSFLPRSRAEQDERLRLLAASIRDWDGENSGPDVLASPHPVIYPSYRQGSGAIHRTVDSMARLVARDEGRVLALYPGVFSADLASLAGRLRLAEARGREVQVSPTLLARRAEAAALEAHRAEHLERFFGEAEARFAGADVYIQSSKTLLSEWAEAGLARGISRLFGIGSVVITGGGDKGQPLPRNTIARIGAFLGVSRVIEMYGMSEMTGICRKCACGHYHIPPYIVPYVLDELSGEPLPREGLQTGRFGFVDLFPEHHWGGFITGDRVTVGGWDVPCGCGRTGPYIEDSVQRIGQAAGGDDKIACAGAPEAHDRAVAFLAGLAD